MLNKMTNVIIKGPMEGIGGIHPVINQRYTTRAIELLIRDVHEKSFEYSVVRR